MYTQVELVSSPCTEESKLFVYWLYNDQKTQPKLKAGQGIRIREIAPYLRVSKVCATLKNLSDLPEKSCVGTIVEIN